MNYLLAFEQPTTRPAGPSSRLEYLRANSSLCIENEAIWWQRHNWQINGTCARCGTTTKPA